MRPLHPPKSFESLCCICVEITAAAKAQHLENSPVQTPQSMSGWSCLQKWSSSVSVLKCCPDFILAHSSRANVISMWFTQLKMFWKRQSSFCIWCNAKFHLGRAAVALCAGALKLAEKEVSVSEGGPQQKKTCWYSSFPHSDPPIHLSQWRETDLLRSYYWHWGGEAIPFQTSSIRGSWW